METWAAGHAVGKFVLVRELATAVGPGAAWLATSGPGDGSSVALDLPDPEADEATGAAREAALREHAEVATALRHPNIVAALDWGPCRGGTYLALPSEVVALTTQTERLAAWVSSDNARREQCIGFIVRSLLEALAHAHALRSVTHPLGRVHGHLSPDAVMIRADGHVLLGGFFRQRGERGGTQALLEDPRIRYIAPEQLHGGPQLPAADLYAVGMILHELLEAAPPWSELTGPDLYRAIVSGPDLELRRPSAPALHRLHAALTARDLRRRCASAEAALALLGEPEAAAVAAMRELVDATPVGGPPEPEPIAAPQRAPDPPPLLVDEAAESTLLIDPSVLAAMRAALGGPPTSRMGSAEPEPVAPPAPWVPATRPRAIPPPWVSGGPRVSSPSEPAKQPHSGKIRAPKPRRHESATLDRTSFRYVERWPKRGRLVFLAATAVIAVMLGTLVGTLLITG